MSGGVESDGRSADDTLNRIDDSERDPESQSDQPKKLSPVWTSSDNLRKLLRELGDPNDEKRNELKGALAYQVPTIVLYWQMGLFFKAIESHTAPSKTVSLYILLFPGEGKDNTGIKDLNDKVIGQWWNGEFIRRRYEAIGKIFNDAHFMVVAQTYKTAYILTYDGRREDFVKKLADLDEALRVILLQILAAAEEDADKNKKKAIKKLRKKLKKKGYRFDIFFGFRSLKPSSATKLQNVYLLVTEALKGAAIARYVAKTNKLGKPFKKVLRIIEPDSKKLDARGKEYDWKVYLKASDIAEKIKALCVKGTYHSEGFLYVLDEVYIDTVWTVTFIERNGLYWGNSDVIRDVRKKKLKAPPMRQGNMTYSTGPLILLLETWLVVLNMLDFVKRFKTDEFAGALLKYHDDALAVYLQLGQPTLDIDWPKLEKVLTHDVRQNKKMAVFESASEFLFYSYASDHSKRIFFSMDVRDMGVELMLNYEHSNREVGYNRHADIALMEETFRASDAIDERRRFTYDRVVEVFRKYYDLLAKGGGTVDAAARAAFAAASFEKLGTFEESAQIMLGGDEVYAAVHPQYAQYVHKIVEDLDKTAYDADRTINVRTSVAFSSEKDATDPDGRTQVQLSHQEAMRLAEEAPSTLKELERAQRRIERLVDMLESNPKKKSRGPGYRTELDKLPLTRLFARSKFGKPTRLSDSRFLALLTACQAGDIAAAEKTKLFELVDFDGNVVDGQKLVKQAAALEDKVRRDVGFDNVRGHPPPVTKMPKWIDKLLDKWSPKKPKAAPGP
jgi:hypothetical protein